MLTHSLSSKQQYRPPFLITNPTIYIFILVNFLLINNIFSDPTVTIKSTSLDVGALTNYSFIIANHSNPSGMTIQFTPWSPLQNQTYTSGASGSKIYLIETNLIDTNLTNITFTKIAASYTFIFPIPIPNSISLNQNMIILMTLVKNPSSTSPYTINFTFSYSNGTSSPTISSTFSVPNVPTLPISLFNYQPSVGVISPKVTWILTFNYYFDKTTILQFTYNKNIINITFNNSLSPVSFNQTTDPQTNITLVILTNWTITASSIFMNYTSITNPQAALTYIINCTLYYISSSNISYNIQNFTIQFDITPLNYTLITDPLPLYLGLPNQTLSINSIQCPFSSSNISSGNISYINISFSTNNIPNSSCPSNLTTNTATCLYNLPNPNITITDIYQKIQPIPFTILTITSYAYFEPLSTYFPVCNTSLQISLIPQLLNNSTAQFDVNKCGKPQIIYNNTNATLLIKNCYSKSGDIVTIQGLITGASINNRWTNNNSNYNFTLTDSNINTCDIQIDIPYLNPTYLTSTNTLTNITISRYFNSTLVPYLIISKTPPDDFTIPVCSVTIPLDLTLSAFNLSSYRTYQPNITLVIQFSYTLNDYSSSDNISIVFQNYENVLYLLNSTVNYNLSFNVSNSKPNLTVFNDTCINISNLTIFNNHSNQIVNLSIFNLINPATTSPITSPQSTFNIIIIFMSSMNTPKQQLIITVSDFQPYQTSKLALSQSKSLPIITTTNLSLNFANFNKTNFNRSTINSLLDISLPFNCTWNGTNNSTFNVSWPIKTLSYPFNLINCIIPYLNSSNAILTINQTILANDNKTFIPSTFTLYTFNLQCNDNCQTCTNNCIQCVNNTNYSLFYLLYKNQCFSICPNGSFADNTTNTCHDCHPSCQNCVNQTQYNCTDCKYFSFLNTTTHLCESNCTPGKFFDQTKKKCDTCQINCNQCVNSTDCYSCKSNAILVGNMICIFTSCIPPCQNCAGTTTNCTSCLYKLYLYNNTCITSCPRNTFLFSDTSSGQTVPTCQEVTVPTLYFPALICSLVLIFLAYICNNFIERGLTAQSRNYIHLLTYSSSILAYMQLFALFILLAFTTTTSSKGLAITGLLIWVICNILFAIYYFTVMKKDQSVQSIIHKMSSKSKCIYYTTLICSIIITLRTYRVLYCGLFLGVAPFSIKPSKPPQKPSTITIQQPSLIKSCFTNTKKIVNLSLSQKLKKQPHTKPKLNKITSTSSKKPQKKTQSPHQQIPKPQPPIQQNTKTYSQSQHTNQSIQQHSKFQLKRPLIIYITLGSILGSLFFLISSIIQIINQNYLAMLLWGLDLLIVVIFSIIISFLDMWAGIKKSYLLALQNYNNNQTLDQLKTNDDLNQPTQHKFLFNQQHSELQEKLKTNKRYKQPSEESENNQQENIIPDIKIFQDVEIDLNINIEPPPTKTKKLKPEHQSNKYFNTTKKNQTSKSNNTMTRGSNLSYKFDDIFLGFKQAQLSQQPQKNYKFFNSNSTISKPSQIPQLPNYNLQKQSPININNQDQIYYMSNYQKLKSKQKGLNLSSRQSNNDMLIIMQTNPKSQQDIKQ